jgi:hypothetical protein
MDRWMCLGSMGVAGLLLLLFLLDFVLGMAGLGFLPFGGISWFVDIVCILASGVVLYLAWDTLRGLR